MKICILSMQNVQNMGSLLQSYSLKKILEKMGHEVSFLNIEPRREDNALLGEYRNSMLGEVQSNTFLARLKRVDRYSINRLRMKAKIKHQNDKYDAFRKGVLGINNGENDGCKYDWCVIGSDEVFNCCDSSPWGFTTQLFGDVKEAKHVLTYAASCGATIATQIPEEAQKRISTALRNLKAISVRDNNTKEFVMSIAGRNAEINFDPVLVEDFEEEIASSIKLQNLPQKYCIIYAYYNRIYKDDEVKAIQGFCQHHHLSLIAVGMPQFWIKDYIVADPFQCLSIFKEASFVITDTFHGTIFSLKYCLRFATVVRDSNKNKLQDLINRIQITDHKVREITLEELEKVYTQVHDKEKFNALIESEKERTMAYLKENMSVTNKKTNYSNNLKENM